MDATPGSAETTAGRPAQDLLAALWAYTPDLVVVLDGAGAVLHASPSVRRILGHAPEAIHGTALLALVHPADRRSAETALADAGRPGGSPVRVALRWRDVDGSWRLLDVTVDGRLDDPSVRGLIVTAHDATARPAPVPRPLSGGGRDVAAYGREMAAQAQRLTEWARTLAGESQQMVASHQRARLAEQARSAADAARRLAEDRQSLAEELAAQRADELRRLETIIEQMPVGVLIATAPSGRIILSNAWVQNLWRDAFPEVAGIGDYARLGARRADGHPYRAEEHPLARALVRGEIVREEEIGLIPDAGPARVVLVNAAPIRAADGAIIAAVATLDDITARTEAEAALRASEQRLQVALEAADMGSWDWDLATDRAIWNEQHYRLFGLPPAGPESSYAAFMSGVHPDDRARVGGALRAAIAGDGLFQAEFRVVWPDGSTHWLAGRGRVQRASASAGGRMSGVTMDTTERREAERALRAAHDELERRVAERTADLTATNRRLRTAMDARRRAGVQRERALDQLRAEQTRLAAILAGMGDAVLVVDERGTPILTNAAYARLCGPDGRLEPQDEEGRPLPAEDGLLARAARGETFTASFTVSPPGAAGGRLWCEANGRPIGYDGSSWGVVVIRDITDRSLRRLQDEFLAMASHELRTPLTPLQGYLDLLRLVLGEENQGDRGEGDAGEGEGDAARYAALAFEQAQRLKVLVDDLLDVGRLHGNKLHLDRGPMDLAEVIDRAVSAARLQTAQTIVADTIPTAVYGDATRLQQVMLNLLVNAITYAPRSRRIVVRLRHVDGQAELQVRDRGPGIPAADLPHLFSRFYQVERRSGPSRQGLGLGLYICRELVTAHDGSIAVRSARGAGTTVTVTLPLLGAEARP